MDWQKSQLDLNNLTQMWENGIGGGKNREQPPPHFYEFNFFLPTHTHSSLQNQSLSPPFYGPSAAADDDDDVTALLHRDHITNS